MFDTNYLDKLAADYRARGFRVKFVPFKYSASWLPLVQDTAQEQKITIDSDSDFVCTSIERAVFSTAVPGVWDETPIILSSISVSTAQRTLDNEPTMLVNVAGVGGRPSYLSKPLVLKAKSVVIVKLESGIAPDTGGGSPDRNVYLTLSGLKAYVSA